MKVERPQPPQVSDLERGYFAALIDGEGSICIAKTKDRKRKTAYWTLQLRIYNTYLTVLEWLIPRFGGRIFRGVTPKSSKHKQGYVWIATTRPALVLLEFIRPILIIKPRHADIAIELFAKMWAIKDEARDNGLPVGHVDNPILLRLFEELRMLNRRGPPPASSAPPGKNKAP